MNRFAVLGRAILAAMIWMAFLPGAAAAQWLTTDQGCKIWSSYPIPNVTVTWTGSQDENAAPPGRACCDGLKATPFIEPMKATWRAAG